MISKEGVGSSPTTPDITDADALVGLPRLVYHVRENNVAYLLATLISYQLGLFQFLQTQAGGMC